MVFFGAICAIVIAIVVLQVFLTGGTRVEQVATAMLYALVGLAVILLLFGVARTAVQSMQERPSHGRSNQRWRFAWRDQKVARLVMSDGDRPPTTQDPPQRRRHRRWTVCPGPCTGPTAQPRAGVEDRWDDVRRHPSPDRPSSDGNSWRREEVFGQHEALARPRALTSRTASLVDVRVRHTRRGEA
jgi:hypothetical protein